MIFEEGHMITEELVIVSKKANNLNLAKQFVDFMVTEEIQKIISAKNIMYPINDEAIPEKMKKLDKPITLNAARMTSKELVSEWLKATIN